MTSIYQPAEDSYFFAEFLKKELQKRRDKNTISNGAQGLRAKGKGGSLQTSKDELQTKSGKNIFVNNISFLDMGTGSGILAQTAKEIGIKNITAIDINKEAITILQKKEPKITCIHSDLFTNLKKNQTFDIICFNAPYLPYDPREPKESQLATTGGKKGDEISVEFLKQAKQHLTKNGVIYLLISSLTPQNNIKKWNPKVVAKKHIFGEDLIILAMKK